MFINAVRDQNSDNSLTQSLLDAVSFLCYSCSILYNLHTLRFVLIYNPKSEKVGTVWKTQIKKVVISKFTLTCISLQTI